MVAPRKPFVFPRIMSLLYFTPSDAMSAISQWMIPLKEAASLLWDLYHDALQSLTFLSLNVLSQKT